MLRAHALHTRAERPNWKGRHPLISIEGSVRGRGHLVRETLVPVRIDLEADLGLYIEPSVWMYHSMETAPSAEPD